MNNYSIKIMGIAKTNDSTMSKPHQILPHNVSYSAKEDCLL